MDISVGRKNDGKEKRWEGLDSADFTSVAESITSKHGMTTQKTHCSGKTSTNSRFYTE